MVVKVESACTAYRAMVSSRRLPCTGTFILVADRQVPVDIYALVRLCHLAFVGDGHAQAQVLMSAEFVVRKVDDSEQHCDDNSVYIAVNSATMEAYHPVDAYLET